MRGRARRENGVVPPFSTVDKVSNSFLILIGFGFNDIIFPLSLFNGVVLFVWKLFILCDYIKFLTRLFYVFCFGSKIVIIM